MNFKEKLSPSAQKKLSDLLFIFYAEVRRCCLTHWCMRFASHSPLLHSTAWNCSAWIIKWQQASFRYLGTWYPSLSESNLFLNIAVR